MNLSSLSRHLRERIGLDPESLGANALSRTMTSRMKKLSIDDLDQYARHVLNDEAECQCLVEDLMVPESWFFRGGEVFSFLGQVIADKTKSPGFEGPFQILCLPCSTGEEPYSLAITLDQLQVPTSSYSIDGVDISSRHVAQARAARYRELSFRQTSSAIKSCYFREIEKSWELIASIRDAVRFEQANLFDPAFIAAEKRYDLIFCRNLLIYLHADARRQAIEILHGKLRADGLLCVGHAEPIGAEDRRFVSFGPTEHFLYRKSGDPASPALKSDFALKCSHAPVADRASRSSSQSPRLVEQAKHSPKKLKPSAAMDVSEHAPRRADAAHETVIDRARRAADEGHLAEALSMCETELASGKPSSDLYALVGVIQQAMQETEKAEKAFARALYLDPAHQEALTHLMILTEGRGDRAGAERLRQRLSRATKRGGT